MRRILFFLSLYKNFVAILGVVSLFIAALIRFFLPELIDSIIGLLILSLILLLAYVVGAHAEDLRQRLHVAVEVEVAQHDALRLAGAAAAEYDRVIVIH